MFTHFREQTDNQLQVATMKKLKQQQEDEKRLRRAASDALEDSDEEEDAIGTLDTDRPKRAGRLSLSRSYQPDIGGGSHSEKTYEIQLANGRPSLIATDKTRNLAEHSAAGSSSLSSLTLSESGRLTMALPPHFYRNRSMSTRPSPSVHHWERQSRSLTPTSAITNSMTQNKISISHSPPQPTTSPSLLGSLPASGASLIEKIRTSGLDAGHSSESTKSPRLPAFSPVLSARRLSAGNPTTVLSPREGQKEPRKVFRFDLE